ncbi:hypothetical protein NDU88_003273 [Pleurodeles waltl]|uniref:Uncharacterized protein n=1 Tax=Pleurodeles waltl TaxID=8319 RepID=A0AAV7LEW6_PLEWA|nr:hypothetical protein NDU88_003273 [Pleurodeles waltl]
MVKCGRCQSLLRRQRRVKKRFLLARARPTIYRVSTRLAIIYFCSFFYFHGRTRIRSPLFIFTLLDVRKPEGIFSRLRAGVLKDSDSVRTSLLRDAVLRVGPIRGTRDKTNVRPKEPDLNFGDGKPYYSRVCLI